MRLSMKNRQRLERIQQATSKPSFYYWSIGINLSVSAATAFMVDVKWLPLVALSSAALVSLDVVAMRRRR